MKYPFMLCQEFDPARIDDPSSFVVEIKEDGVLVMWDGFRQTLWNRSGINVTHRYPDVVPYLPSTAVLVMGMCVFRGYKSMFEGGIQKRMAVDNPKEIRLRQIMFPCTAVVFDALEISGVPLVGLPQSERRAMLKALFGTLEADGQWFVARRTNPRPPTVVLPRQWTFDQFNAAKEMVQEKGFEGLVVKDLRAPYVGERSWGYMKFKNWHEVVLPVLRSERTERDGFVAIVTAPDGKEQKVVVNDLRKQPLVKTGATIKVGYLEVSGDGRYRQPHLLGVV
jgi:bifunctional non-homologous end joining protein LigD